MTQVFESFSNSRSYFPTRHSPNHYPNSYPKKPFMRASIEKTPVKESRLFYPIPKGDSPYALAKKSEYIDKDLSKAEYFYKLAIEQGDRPESAIKDLAGVIHQQGKTLEAIEILKQHKHLFYADMTKYENLLQNLKRQVVQKGNRLNKLLKISPLPLDYTTEMVKNLFGNDKRISDVELYSEGPHIYAILKFSTHSAARKTLESFLAWEKFKVEWISITGDSAGDANHKRGEPKKDRVLFVYKVFQRDPESKALVLPIDSDQDTSQSDLECDDFEFLIGKDLSKILDS
jgi:hypothetical protein